MNSVLLFWCLVYLEMDMRLCFPDLVVLHAKFVAFSRSFTHSRTSCQECCFTSMYVRYIHWSQSASPLMRYPHAFTNTCVDLRIVIPADGFLRYLDHGHTIQ
jgi:hypothetical protein